MRHFLRYLVAPVLLIGLAGGVTLVRAQVPYPPRGGEVIPEALVRQVPALNDRAHVFQRAVQDLGGERAFGHRFVRDVEDFTRATDNLRLDTERTSPVARLRRDFDDAYGLWARVIAGVKELPSPYRGQLKEVAEKVQPMLIDVGRDVGLRVEAPDPLFP